MAISRVMFAASTWQKIKSLLCGLNLSESLILLWERFFASIVSRLAAGSGKGFLNLCLCWSAGSALVIVE